MKWTFQADIYLLVGMRLDLGTRSDTKSQMAMRLHKSERSLEHMLLRIEIEPNDHYQNVDIGLKFILEASKTQKTCKKN